MCQCSRRIASARVGGTPAKLTVSRIAAPRSTSPSRLASVAAAAGASARRAGSRSVPGRSLADSTTSITVARSPRLWATTSRSANATCSPDSVTALAEARQRSVEQTSDAGVVVAGGVTKGGVEQHELGAVTLVDRGRPQPARGRVDRERRHRVANQGERGAAQHVGIADARRQRTGAPVGTQREELRRRRRVPWPRPRRRARWW